ncbi:hypothetical protein CIPAW_04G003500 [Carya illinoinensis]|uniref:Uncharacterized protein n=1 Tax=Carya illinoinensis TaxID=32201 RepID=A0A8T1QNM9_CARIL|nr:hypothetical protein CIPAW_04G003500 [Carya illinoinensis]
MGLLITSPPVMDMLGPSLWDAWNNKSYTSSLWRWEHWGNGAVHVKVSRRLDLVYGRGSIGLMGLV